MTDLNHVLAWERVAVELVGLGVHSFATIRATMQDADADEATITALEAKWDALVADVARAAHPDPA